VVLVHPRNPLNIGAAARAMANFGFSRLSVVAPYAPHWREAKSAVGAPELLESATEFATLAEAVADCTLVAGTATLTHRSPEQRVISLPEFGPIAADALAQNGRIALVFGPEKHGLTRNDLSYCHLLVEIPTDPRQPSMNLGQAVAVCLYEMTRDESGVATSAPESGAIAGTALDSTSVTPATASGDLDRLAAVVEETMAASGYSPSTMRQANRHGLRVLLRRLRFTEPDSRRALRLFRRILWRLRPLRDPADEGPASH
jgi:TrmH family RNA methyltransferase